MYTIVDRSWSDHDQGYVYSKLDLTAAKAAASKQRDAARKTIDLLTDEDAIWPAKARKTVTDFADELHADTAHAQNLAIASSKAGFFDQWTSAPDLSKAGTLSQKIRALLDLPADAAKSCNL